MANVEHLAILRQGVGVWNAWRREHPGVWPDLDDVSLSLADLISADLRRAKLIRADLSGADLSSAGLSDAILSRADLISADLIRADLSGAKLIRADLSGAKLIRAKLIRADLSDADLSRADLTGADLGGVDLGYTVFFDTNLASATGLDTCHHYGPSTIDHFTLAKSGPLPKVFLQGCGLPDWLIEAYKLTQESLSRNEITNIVYEIDRLRGEQPLQFHSCFISYSSQNEDFARKLHDSLQEKGVRCWFAPEDLKIGDRIRHAIDAAIRLHDKLLLILSKEAIDSGWVQYEADRALSRELAGKRTILFPVRVDDAVFGVDEGWALHIKEDRHIGDFCSWGDDKAYTASFERLLRDLRAS